MRTLVSAFLFDLLALATVASYLFVLPPESPVHQRFATDAEHALSVVPDPALRARLGSRATAVADWVMSFLGRVGATQGLNVHPPIVLATVRAALAAALLPVAGAVLLAGVLAGLLRRRLLMEDVGFHSLTFSYLGKVVASFSAALYAFTALSPIGPPLWALYVFTLTAAAGAGLWFGNLPPRI